MTPSEADKQPQQTSDNFKSTTVQDDDKAQSQEIKDDGVYEDITQTDDDPLA